MKAVFELTEKETEEAVQNYIWSRFSVVAGTVRFQHKTESGKPTTVAVVEAEFNNPRRMSGEKD